MQQSLEGTLEGMLDEPWGSHSMAETTEYEENGQNCMEHHIEMKWQGKKI